MSVGLEFSHVSKAYRLGERTRGLREALAAAGRSMLGRARNGRNPVLWALWDVSFRIATGEAVGIIGPNGAGKTTILKLLSKITQCTSGDIRVNGRVSSLIELGAGFHPDLTGRENIFLNGSILGMSLKQIRERFNEIVEFSGLDGFLDTPVKRYSSGMYARLGFSVAAHTGADILLVDEVLAVGDIGFQTKSVQKMRELVKAGTTVVFVSHSLYYISHFCDRAMFLDHGQVKECGPPPEVIGAYQEMMQSRTASECIAAADPPDGTLPSGAPARILEVQLQDRDGITRDRFDMGESLVLRVRVQAPERVKSPVVEFVIMSAAGTLCYKSHNHADGVPMPDVCGEVEVLIEFPELRLLPNTYVISVRLLESGAIGVYDRKESVRNFTISHRGACVAAESGLFYLPHRWRVGA